MTSKWRIINEYNEFEIIRKQVVMPNFRYYPDISLKEMSEIPQKVSLLGCSGGAYVVK